MMRSSSKLARFLLLLGLLAMLGPALAAQRIEPDAEGPAGAEDERGERLTVGDGSPASCTEMALRHALIVAEASGGRTIRFNCGRLPVVISLSEPAAILSVGPVLLVPPDNTTINGGGVITLLGIASGVVVFVGRDTAVVLKDLSITHRGSLFPSLHNEGTLTLSSSTVSDNASGGGIVNAGTLTVDNSTISDNGLFSRGGIDNSGQLRVKASVVSGNAGFGAGGIFNSGTATVTHSMFFDNAAEGDGGIANFGMLTISHSEFSNNHGIFGDGGIGNAGTLTVKNSTFSGNLARSGGAGGIGNEGALSVTGSEFSANDGAFGGGIAHFGGTLTVENSDFSRNHALVFGGGIYNCAGAVAVHNSTITNNTAGQQGGGIYTCVGAATTLKKTSVTGNAPDDIAP